MTTAPAFTTSFTLSGVRTIEHAIRLDDDAIEMMLDDKHTLVPTLVASEWVIPARQRRSHAELGRR